MVPGRPAASPSAPKLTPLLLEARPWSSGTWGNSVTISSRPGFEVGSNDDDAAAAAFYSFPYSTQFLSEAEQIGHTVPGHDLIQTAPRQDSRQDRSEQIHATASMMIMAVAQQPSLHYPPSLIGGRTQLSSLGRYGVVPSSTHADDLAGRRPSDVNESGFPYLSPASSQTSTWKSPPHRHSTGSSQPPRGPASPFASDRTPIRHHRPDMHRNRSSNSRTNAFLSYANGPPQQIASLVASAPISISSTHDSIGEQDDARNYASMPSVTSYMNQPANFYTGSLPPTYQPFSIRIAESSGSAGGIYNEVTHGGSIPPAYGGFDQPETVFVPPRPALIATLPVVSTEFRPIQPPLDAIVDDSDTFHHRQRLQCWDHGCNGRQFSTFSNLLRHQREKSGTATKARCPHCGTEFTRTTARNGHLYGGKCKGIQGSTKDENFEPGFDEPGRDSMNRVNR